MQPGAKLMDTVHVLAANLNRLVEWHKERKTGLGSNQDLGAKAGVSSNTIGRMRRGDGSVGIGKLSKVAKALKLDANGVSPAAGDISLDSGREIARYFRPCLTYTAPRSSSASCAPDL